MVMNFGFPNLLGQLPPAPIGFETSLASTGVLTACVLLVYVLLFYALRFWVRSFQTDVGIVAVRVSQFPVLAVCILASLRISLSGDAAIAPFHWWQSTLDALMVAMVTYWIATLITQVGVHALKEYANKSEVQWDDVLVPILETTLPILIYLIGSLLVLQALGLDLTGLWVAVGGATFVLGFALKDILSNFFSGLVLLIDTPFRFGDVLALENGTRAVIKKIGLRVTELYVIDKHCELYMPNAGLQAQPILNLSRPTADYYYTITVPVKHDVDPGRVIQLMEAVVLGHPDTLGNVQQKLNLIEQYYSGSSSYIGSCEREQRKREAGIQRLLVEQTVNIQLAKIEQAFIALSEKVCRMEANGLDPKEIREIQGDYLDICQLLGLEVVSDRGNGLRKRMHLEEIQIKEGNQTLIGTLREWYQKWLKDPDLLQEDHKVLPKLWEHKVDLLKLKANKLFRKTCQLSTDETRLDNAVENFSLWMRENFKTTSNEWQEPKIWVSEVFMDTTTHWLNKKFNVRFYVDDITLEHFQRGYRVESEIRREIDWHLRSVYLNR